MEQDITRLDIHIHSTSWSRTFTFTSTPLRATQTDILRSDTRYPIPRAPRSTRKCASFLRMHACALYACMLRLRTVKCINR